MTDTLLILIPLIVVIAACVWIYNRLVHDQNMVANGWSDIDVQLLRRHDLIPQLVTTVQAYADYERATLEAVTELRTQSKDASNLATKAATETAIAAGVEKLIAVAEDYPELKADKNFRQLSEALIEIENHLQYARRFYNGAVRIFNTRVQSFPHLLLARPLGFSPADFFGAPEDADNAPQIAIK